MAAQDFDDLFKSDSLENFGGPSFRWAILNYGRIQNNVRVQDARFQALIGDYENTVLQAQGEVENAIAAYLGTQRQVNFLSSSVASAARAVELAEFQYREGAVDYTRVLNSQQFLVTEQDRLVFTQGSVALNLVAMYKALGGGWELRIGKDLVPARKQAANDRTDSVGRNAHDRRADAGPRCRGLGDRSRARLVALALVVARMVACHFAGNGRALRGW